ncbi:MAG: aldose 1-epimerase family protein [Planctomycetota bacterium]|nr:aldose 1-epimerase family protein [Planctomycetota bacterium]
MVVDKRVLQGGKRQGVDSLKVVSDDFSFEVLPTRGMNLWKIWAGQVEYGWQAPAKGPVNPSFVPLMEPGGLGWLDGFDEVFVRCGLESNGAPEHDADGRLQYPLHGKIGNTPARKVEVSIDDDVVRVIGVVEESRFHFMKMRMTSILSWKVGSSSLEIEDQIENLSASDHEIQMLYHINFGVPLLDAGSRFVAPVKKVVPRNDHAASSIGGWENYSAATAGYEEQVYFLEMAGDPEGNTKTVLKNAHSTAGVAIRYNVKQLPCYTVWKNTTAVEDGYVTGLEPGTNYPNPRTFEGEQERVIRIGGNQKTTLHVGLDFLTTEKDVSQAERDVKKLMPAETIVFDKPQKGWCHGVD